MGDSGGHFEKGRWVEDTKEEPASSGPSSSEPQNEFEARIRSAAGQIGKGIDELIAAGSELLGTSEGRQHLGKKLDLVTGDLMKVCEDLKRDGMDFINQTKDRFKK